MSEGDTFIDLDIYVVRDNGSAPVPDQVNVKILLVYFDVYVEDIYLYEKGTNNSIDPIELVEGTEIDIQVVTICEGKRSQSDIHLGIYMDGKLLHTLTIPESNPQSTPSKREVYTLNYTLTLDKLPWDMKQDKYEMEIRVDEEGSIWESQERGIMEGENNNQFTVTWKVNDAPLHIAVSLTLIFILLALVLVLVFVVYYKERRPYLVIALAVFVGILGYLFFSIPWQTMEGLETNVVNGLGKAIIGVTLVFLLMVILLSLRSTYPYLRYKLLEIDERTKKANERRKRRLGLEPSEDKIGPADDAEGGDDEGKEEMFSSRAIPYLIILTTSIIGILALILLSGIVLATATGNAADVIDPFIGFFIWIPNLVWVGAFFLLGIILIILVQRGQVRALDDILDADRIIERLKKDAEMRMYSEEHGEREYYEDFDRGFRGPEDEDYYEGGGDY